MFTFAERFRGVPGHAYEQGGDVRLVPEKLDLPLRWERPRRIFVNSMSDLFHEDIPDEYIERVFAVMERATWHTFQVLTKRSARMAAFTRGRVIPPHIWLGVSVESKDYAWRIDDLRDVPCGTRFVSAEPLLGSLSGVDLSGIAWVIVGGESGGHARPMEASWVRELRDQCLGAGVAFFFKQWGGLHKKEAGRKLDGQVYDAFPLRIVHSVDRDGALLAASARMEV